MKKNIFLLGTFAVIVLCTCCQRKGRLDALPINKTWDVIVVGGGPAGCAAAIASAREGAKTLLIEATGALGGMGTSGAMNNWCPFSDGNKIIYKGIAEEIYWKAKQGVPHFPKNDHQWLPINTEQLKRVYDIYMKIKEKWASRDLNPGPDDYESSALTD